MNQKIVFSILVLLFSISLMSNAQSPESPIREADPVPLDGIVEKTIHKQRRILPYAPIREADIFWEKKVWRVIDTRQKMNLHFRYPKRMFFDILKEGILDGSLTAYHINDQEDFSEPMSTSEVEQSLYTVDTIPIYDPNTGQMDLTVVKDEFNSDDVKRFRVKEVWYFDSNTSTMKSRIIGIAPLLDVYDDFGEFKYELPMFWIYFPHARQVLGHELAFNGNNDNAPMSWDDIFNMRYFASNIYKSSNIYDRKLEGVPGLQGVDLLLESKKLNDEIFNFEHDLWEM